jgi:hypothetical protein
MRHVCAEGIVAQRANILVASPDQENTLALWGRRPRVTGLMRHVCAEGFVAQRASLLVASRRPRKTRWPCRGRRPRINKPLHRYGLPICRPYGALKTLARRCFATNISPLRGFEDAGAAMSCYRYVAPTGLFRPVWAEGIVAQRANILVARPRPTEHVGPVGAEDRA